MFLAGVLCLASLAVSLPAAADNYTGDYAWLRFWNAEVKTSDTYHNGWDRVGWLGHKDNTEDHWYVLEWSEAMTLTGARVEVWAQIDTGTGGYIGEYYLQYWDASLDDPDWVNINTSAGTLSGFTSYNVSFTAPVTTTAIRVYFPEGNYAIGNSPNSGPGVAKLLPIGNLASGLGLDPADPKFNLLATDWSTSSDPFLGITPTVWLQGRTPNENNPAKLLDNNLTTDWERAGWHPTMDGSETFVCDLGTSLLVHGVTLYGGTHMSEYLPTTMDVYVTDDLDDWGNRVGVLERVAGYCVLSDVDTAGRYIILTNPPLDSWYILPQELAVNATAIPEPVTMTLLTLGGLAVLRRRK